MNEILNNKDENRDGIKDVEQLDSTRKKLNQVFSDYKQEAIDRWTKKDSNHILPDREFNINGKSNPNIEKYPKDTKSLRQFEVHLYHQSLNQQ